MHETITRVAKTTGLVLSTLTSVKTTYSLRKRACGKSDWAFGSERAYERTLQTPTDQKRQPASAMSWGCIYYYVRKLIGNR